MHARAFHGHAAICDGETRPVHALEISGKRICFARRERHRLRSRRTCTSELHAPAAHEFFRRAV